MDEVLGLAQVERRILDLCDMLEKATLASKRRYEAAAQADTDYDVEFSKALLLAKEGRLPGQDGGCSDQTAKAHAVVVCADKLQAKNIAEALLESAREAARNYRAQLDALRSICANVRSLTVAS